MIIVNRSVIHSPLRFFISNPTGRILNRFTKDQNLVDEMLPVTFFLVLEIFLFCLSAIILVIIAFPYMLILMVPLIYAFLVLKKKYTLSTRELKRIEAVTRSPIYSGEIIEIIIIVMYYPL